MANDWKDGSLKRLPYEIHLIFRHSKRQGLNDAFVWAEPEQDIDIEDTAPQPFVIFTKRQNSFL